LPALFDLAGRIFQRTGNSVPGFPNCLQDLLDRGLEKEDSLGHRPAVHLDREFARLPGDHLHFDSRFLAQGVCHTGSMLARAASDRAFANGYFFHG